MDIVGITCMTPLAPRAYEIAAEFRRRGAVVVLGGIHVSMLPDEALGYADAVVIGEGEEVWPGLLADFIAGRLQLRYTGADRPNLSDLRVPRRDLLYNKYFVQTVQTSRGCPHSCRFCSVTRFNGGHFHIRSIDKVIAEIEALSDQRLFIIDDSIISPNDLHRGLIEAYRQVASPWRSPPRGLKTFRHTRSLFSTGISFFWNYDSYKSIKTITRPRLCRG